MSYQMQKCLFDYLRAKKHAPRDQKPDVSVGGVLMAVIALGSRRRG